MLKNRLFFSIAICFINSLKLFLNLFLYLLVVRGGIVSIFYSPLTHAADFETTIRDYQFNSSSKIVIDEKTIQSTQAKDVFTLISTQANISFFNQNFQLPQIFLRGSDSSHILILIDGVPVYDPSWAQRTFNLNSLDIKTVRRIEILKGGQSVIYGGQALAGVIKIETYASSNQKSLLQASLGLGSQQEKQVAAAAYQDINDSLRVGASGRLMQKANQSPVLNSSQTYENNLQNFDISLGSKTDNFEVLGKAFYILDHSYNAITVYDAFGRGTIADTPDFARRDQQYGASLVARAPKALFQPKFTLGLQQGGRSYVQDTPSTSYPTGVGEFLTSQLLTTRLDVTLFQDAQMEIISGVSYGKENLSYQDLPGALLRDGASELRGIFTKASYKVNDQLEASAGLRADSVDSLETRNSYHLGVALFQDLKIEWSSGFRTPSAAQKYGPYPNADLQPETSQTYAISYEYRPLEKMNLSMTVFDTAFNNLIQVSGAPPTQKYINLSRTQSRGIEWTSSYAYDERQIYQATYGYQEPWDVGNARRLDRRPLVTGTLRWLTSWDSYSTMLEGTGVGERWDTLAGKRAMLESYFLVNASIGYKMDSHRTLQLRASNIFDRRPELSSDYFGDGANFFLAVNWNK